MDPIRSREAGDVGYSLIEILVVLAIIGTLTIVGVMTLGNRGGNSVRVVLDELEGAIMDAHKYAASSGRDVAIVTWGSAWDVSTTSPVLLMARGDGAQTGPQIQTVANNLIGGDPSKLPTDDLGKTVAVIFSPSRSREYMSAGVVVKGSSWWTNAMQSTSAGIANDDVTTVAPFSTDTTFQTAFSSDNNLFQGSTGNQGATNVVTISGSNKRFASSFNIQIVGMRSGMAVPGGAMGLIIVQNNGATVYKFYNPGVVNGDGKWRRV